MIPVNWREIRKEHWIVLLLAGILIMTVVFPSKKDTDIPVLTESDTTDSESPAQEIQRYEEKLETLLGQMEGAGQVKVMITESVSRENVVEKDTPYTIQMSQNGSDDENGTKNQQENREETTVYERDDQGNESPYVKKSLAPQIEGVLVLAQGGDNAVVAANITEAVMALFGIEAHKIKVMKMMYYRRKKGETYGKEEPDDYHRSGSDDCGGGVPELFGNTTGRGCIQTDIPGRTGTGGKWL